MDYMDEHGSQLRREMKESNRYGIDRNYQLLVRSTITVISY